MNYFEHVPKIMYPYGGKMIKTAGFDSTVETVDLTVRFKIVESIMNDPSAYTYYEWVDGDRPDIIAQRTYGDANLAWIVMLSASIFDWGYDLPMTESALEEYVTKKYGKTYNELSSTVHHYETSRGYVIDSTTYSTLPAKDKTFVSIIDYESRLNDERRIVKLINSSYISAILKEYDTKLKQIKTNRKITGNV